MAYCNKCGAYIPDGQSACLACGYDENASAGAAQAAQAAKKSQTDTERLRRQMEEQRARQQEQSRQWAQQEAQRRREQQQEQDDRDKARQDARDRARQEMHRETPNGGFSSESFRRSANTDASTSKVMAIISYLSVLCFIPLLFCKDDPFAQFHAKQGLALLIFTTIGNVLGSFLGVGWLFTIAQVFFIFKGISNASSGKLEPLPWIGSLLKF